jgi:hypothetical protein
MKVAAFFLSFTTIGNTAGHIPKVWRVLFLADRIGILSSVWVRIGFTNVFVSLQPFSAFMGMICPRPNLSFLSY